MHWSNSEQRWMKPSEMHTQHIVNALRKGLNQQDRELVDELVRRLDASNDLNRVNAEARDTEVTDTYVITIRRQS